jgi:hypothetical protein
VADAVLTVLLLLAVGATALLALRALRHWHRERTGRAYELPVDRRGALLRAGSSGLAALVAVALAALLAVGPNGGTPRTRPVAEHAPAALPSPPARTPQPAPPAPAVRTLGHPAGGTLQLLRDGTRVWLPPHYSSPLGAGLAYPLVLVHAAADDPDLYPAFAGQAARGRADSFLLVTVPTCGTDPAAVLTEVAARYRVLPARTAHGLLGIAGQAPCAVREALAGATRFAAAAGVAGRYPDLAPPSGRYPSLLLAAGSGDEAARTSAVHLRAHLHPRGDQVRVLDAVARRRDLLGAVAAYFTEKLDGPRHISTEPAPTPGRTSAAPAPKATATTAPGRTRAEGPTPPRIPARAPARTPSAHHARSSTSPVPTAAPPRTAPDRTPVTSSTRTTPSPSTPHTPRPAHPQAQHAQHPTADPR